MPLYMPTQGLQLYRYALPLRHPPHLKTGLLRQRAGLLMAWETRGEKRWAEIAPFPGLSQESLADCLAQIQRARQGLDSGPWLPAVAWGLQQLHCPLPVQNNAAPLPLNALLSDPNPVVLQEQAQVLYLEGYRCFKLKVGQSSLQEDLTRIYALLDVAPDIMLRLDANRSWSVQDALSLSAHLPSSRIAYLEEPLAQLQDYPAFLRRCAVPIALDESLLLPEVAEVRTQMAAWVLKPMVLGPDMTLGLMATAREHGIQITLSSVFESGLGLRYLALLSQQLPVAWAVGLDTWRAWGEDLWEPDFVPSGGAVNFLGNLFTLAPDLRLKWVRPIDDVTETM
ncbi:MAG: o-succinylbenzoate synthase [Candidatus Sericytochromatia bacterium]